jgi:hypothetical protein
MFRNGSALAERAVAVAARTARAMGQHWRNAAKDLVREIFTT